jgi:hypothetical protein
MYDITKTRMLLTTAVFAAIAALYAGGANARILDESGSASGARASIRTGVVDSRFAFESRAGSTRYGYVVGGVLIIPGQSSGQLSSGFNGVADTSVADDRFDVGVGFQYWGV